ncbi:hypothetical protein BDV37DRAFT_27940 [Aspergillus pseudonomiae]|uniref:Uncharacterized protein n=1 Tax=Aspergillus pseudonomiae TaxID=1506151 RepID=A0A5N7CWA6_9EURO|nr:uncharacterized protein BDV37DRAFT_27940 [Aspergillus pseudonomiae]KAE8398475.1 hypothetical protein BDV37DRAFT_27940 [Aspergillus pseudonomiae]
MHLVRVRNLALVGLAQLHRERVWKPTWVEARMECGLCDGRRLSRATAAIQSLVHPRLESPTTPKLQSKIVDDNQMFRVMLHYVVVSAVISNIYSTCQASSSPPSESQVSPPRDNQWANDNAKVKQMILCFTLNTLENKTSIVKSIRNNAATDKAILDGSVSSMNLPGKDRLVLGS